MAAVHCSDREFPPLRNGPNVASNTPRSSSQSSASQHQSNNNSNQIPSTHPKHTKSAPSFAQSVRCPDSFCRESAVIIDNASLKSIDYVSSISKIIGHENIAMISRINSNVRVIFHSPNLATDFCNANPIIKINNISMNVRPLMIPYKKIIVTGSGPWVPNSILTQVLRDNQIPVTPIQFCRLGLDDPRYKHILTENRFCFLDVGVKTFELPNYIDFLFNDEYQRIHLGFERTLCYFCRGPHESVKCPSKEINSHINHIIQEVICNPSPSPSSLISHHTVTQVSIPPPSPPPIPIQPLPIVSEAVSNSTFPSSSPIIPPSSTPILQDKHTNPQTNISPIINFSSSNPSDISSPEFSPLSVKSDTTVLNKPLNPNICTDKDSSNKIDKQLFNEFSDSCDEFKNNSVDNKRGHNKNNKIKNTSVVIRNDKDKYLKKNNGPTLRSSNQKNPKKNKNKKNKSNSSSTIHIEV
uniref:Uncharacterized protein n=1 Tax=Cacopsylla melanoneura TaxID=428564 RepID=A0A8D8RS72_9HEMI